MKRKHFRSALILTIMLMVIFVGSAVSSYAAKAEFMWGRNYYGHSYSTWGDITYSYLVPTDNGYMRVQTGGINSDDIDDVDFDLVGIEYYDDDFNRIGDTYKTLKKELPYWGGFYAYGDYYYIVTGDYNRDESDDKEVIRITKYDKSWNRIDSASLYGSDVYSPFSFGSCDIEGWGHYLIIHTCHQKYQTADGLNHQKNLSLFLDVDKMDKVEAFSMQFASHSFMQLIRTDDDKIVVADHGDSGPRGIRLAVYDDRYMNEDPESSDPSVFTGNGYRRFSVDIIEAAQRSNYRETGVMLGDLQVSDSSYLVAGSSADQSSGTNMTYNVFVGAVNKKTGDNTLRWFTDFSEDGDRHVSNPYLVKINNDTFLLIWNEYGSTEKEDVIKCVYLNGKGEATSEVYKMNGILSDCEPIIKDGQIVWYSYNERKLLFYQMPVSSPQEISCKALVWKVPSDVEIENVTQKLKYSRLKKYTFTVWAVMVTSDCPEKNLSYSGKGVDKKSRKALTFNKKTTAIKVKKGTKKGTYKMKVTVTAKGTSKYLPEKKTGIITIKVK
ncbi:MAG: hypothetical protein IKF07_06055 [Eubacterium sp.]|nr:hypothetical protein [Eubacterium sp.]